MTDSGGGIDEQHLGKIFDPFFTTKPVGDGLGLGLQAVTRNPLADPHLLGVTSGATLGAELRINGQVQRGCGYFGGARND